MTDNPYEMPAEALQDIVEDYFEENPDKAPVVVPRHVPTPKETKELINRDGKAAVKAYITSTLDILLNGLSELSHLSRESESNRYYRVMSEMGQTILEGSARLLEIEEQADARKKKEEEGSNSRPNQSVNIIASPDMIGKVVDAVKKGSSEDQS